MNRNSKIVITAVVIVVVIFVAWHWQHTQQKDNGTVTIGVAVGETGDASEWGQGEFNVFKMYVDDVNANGGIGGHPIMLDVEDTRSTGDGTVTAVTKLISVNQIPVILGPTWADSFQGANPIAEQAKTVLLTPSAAIETVQNKSYFTYLFSTWWPQAPEIETLLGYMAAHNMKNIAIINDHDPFDTKFTDDFASAVSQKGFTVVDREQVPIDQNDFRTEILKVKQFHPDALFIQINNVAELGPFMRQVKSLGLSAVVFSSTDAQNEDAVKKFGSAMEGLTYAFVKTPSGNLYNSFVKEYQEKYNALPSTPSILPAYNAIAALVAVLKNGARTGTEIRDALYGIHTSGIGVSEISFNSLGQINNAEFEMRMIHNSQFVTIPQ
jgi:branched-chain amino acid transport system substrate-binding protein